MLQKCTLTDILLTGIQIDENVHFSVFLFAFIRRTKFSKALKKQKYFQLQTSFHHDKQHGFIMSVENVIITRIVHTADGPSVV